MAETAIVPNDDYSVDHDPTAKGFRLKGDLISPGANMVYGTNGAGVKGWQSATAADGSETAINQGTGVTVTGTGTAADPYVINANPADGSETAINQGTGVTVTGTGTAADPYVINANPADGSETAINQGTGVTVTGTGTAADPYVINANVGGSPSRSFDEDTLGSATSEVTRQGGSPTAVTNPTGGNYNYVASLGAYTEKIILRGDNGDVDASSQVIISFDNSANSRDRRFTIQIYDLINDQMADLHGQGIVPKQETTANVTVITLTNMNGFSNFEIILQ